MKDWCLVNNNQPTQVGPGPPNHPESRVSAFGWILEPERTPMESRLAQPGNLKEEQYPDRKHGLPKGLLAPKESREG